MRKANLRGISGTTLIEMLVALALVAVIGLSIYALLTIGMVLGGKNAAVNTAHQQARVAMFQMVQNLHSSVSLPALTDENGTVLVNPAANSAAAGISFQLWSAGPYQIVADAAVGSPSVQIQIPDGARIPVASQRLIIPGHQVETDISSVTSLGAGKYTVVLAANLPVAIQNTGPPNNYNTSCFITDRVSYTVKNSSLTWSGPTTRRSYSILGSDIVSATPFTTPSTPAGALYYRFVAAINLSTCDSKYNNRGFKSANILLNGQVPVRARLALYQ
jgi:prepilin-type N-terminal cleavage/methylation domain-containing protein